MDFGPAAANLVAEAEVDGQVGTQLVVILDEHLGALEPGTVLGRDAGVPVIGISEQEVRIVKTCAGIGAGDACGIERPVAGIGTVELEGSGIGVAPGGGVVLVDEELATEVQDMLAADHGDDVRGIEDVLLVDGIGAGVDPGVRVRADELNGGQAVGLGELPAELALDSPAESQVGVEVALVGVAEANLVDGVGGDVGDDR